MKTAEPEILQRRATQIFNSMESLLLLL